MSNAIIAIGVAIFALIVLSLAIGIGRRFSGLLLTIYGIYLAALTGSSTQFVIPGVGSIGAGAAAGAGVGFLTWALVGTLGVATGGAGFAIGAAGMVLIGTIVGGVGAASGGVGFETITYPLVSPWFWVPIIIVGLSLLFRPSEK
jgi:hypothetical protein